MSSAGETSQARDHGHALYRTVVEPAQKVIVSLVRETIQTRDHGHALFRTVVERSQKADRWECLPTIYKVPDALRRLNQSAYTPQLLSIGPLHGRLKSLKPQMEDAKHNYVNQLLDRTAGDSNADDIGTRKLKKFKECLTAMEGLLSKARECYAEESEALDKETMVIDGCFMIELFYRCYRKSPPHQINVPEKQCCGCLFDYFLSKSQKPDHDRPRNETGTNDQDTSELLRKDPFLGSPLTRYLLKLDLLLLENQLPLFVLEKLFELTVRCIPNRDPEQADMTVTDYALSFFEDILHFEARSGAAVTINEETTQDSSSPSAVTANVVNPQENSSARAVTITIGTTQNNYSPTSVTLNVENPKENSSARSPSSVTVNFENPRENSSAHSVTINLGTTQDNSSTRGRSNEAHHIKPYHILHLLHQKYKPSYQPTEEGFNFRRTASDLDVSGVKFTAPTNKNHMFHVDFREPPGVASWFKRACFEIRKLPLYDCTETYLRNLIAFEQCCPGVSRHITSYAMLMDTLIDDEKDVKLLEIAGVIRNFLGSDEYAKDLFNNLCKQVVPGESYFAKQCNSAERYRGPFLPRILAYLKRMFLDSPWTFIGFIVAFITFGITITSFILGFA